MEYQYPTILRRYLSTFIDGLLIIVVLLVVSHFFDKNIGASNHIRVAILAFMFLVYEPLCTSLACTLGQKITGIRVRTLLDHKRISIPAAYVRLFLKTFLGFISFISIAFSKDKRAIHDFAVGSVVVLKQ